MRVIFCGLVTCALICHLAVQASATTYTINCVGTAATDQAAFTTALGTNYANLANGDTIQVNGTVAPGAGLCAGDYYFMKSGVTITNHTGGTSGLITTDGFDGMVEVSGSYVTINGIELQGSSLNPHAPSTATIPSIANEFANLFLHDAAGVLLENAQSGPGLVDGVYALRASGVTILNSTITGNGTGGFGNDYSSGMRASEGSSLRIGNEDDSAGSSFFGNGQYTSGASCAGFDILLTHGASANLYWAELGGTTSTTGANCGEIYAYDGSSVHLGDSFVNHFGGIGPVIQAISSSSVVIDSNVDAASPTGSTVTEVVDGGGVSVGLVLASGTSSILLQGSSLTTPTMTQPTIEASSGSSLTIAGGNTISNSASGGMVLEIDHLSNLTQQLGSLLGYPNAVETISGSGFIQQQSAVDLGQGSIGSSASLTWNAPSGDCILVQQNSSFRVSGGVTITGAPAAACALNGGAVTTTVEIFQSSNAFFNLGHGGADNIAGGGSVSCVFTSFPNAHITGKGNIIPTGAQPVIIGSWSAAATATSPGCMGP